MVIRRNEILEYGTLLLTDLFLVAVGGWWKAVFFNLNSNFQFISKFNNYLNLILFNSISPSLSLYFIQFNITFFKSLNLFIYSI